jgi:hypothetical protein
MSDPTRSWRIHNVTASQAIFWLTAAVYAIPFLVCAVLAGWGWFVGSNAWVIGIWCQGPYLVTCPIGLACSFGCRNSILAASANLMLCGFARLLGCMDTR